MKFNISTELTAEIKGSYAKYVAALEEENALHQAEINRKEQEISVAAKITCVLAFCQK